MAANHRWLIIGQGLAGSCLAYSLLERQQEVTLIDRGHATASTWVAAGVFHPIQIRKLSKSWKVDRLIPEVRRFFGAMQSWIGQDVLESREVLRLFTSTEEFNNWFARSQELGFEAVLDPETITPGHRPAQKLPHHGGRVLGGGWINLPAWLTGVRERLQREGRLIERKLEYDQLSLTEAGLFQGAELLSEGYQGVIFCDGWQLPRNPFFGWLPFQEVKGEVLTVHCPGLDLKEIANRKLIVVPLGNDKYRIGSTNQWKNIDLEVTEAAQEELLERLTVMLDRPFEVIDQQAGVRPTVPDRRPLLGRHPHMPYLALFNGLGSRGVMYAPYYAGQMADYLIEGKEVDSEVNLIRFKKHLAKSTLQSDS
ncbi:MAG: NAD(P)/FAD-dependent oxidoreductase [Salibacteraceae bacterium]